jgi:hypothetical protein
MPVLSSPRPSQTTHSTVVPASVAARSDLEMPDAITPPTMGAACPRCGSHNTGGGTNKSGTYKFCNSCSHQW